MNKIIATFSKELDKIKDKDFLAHIVKLIDSLPDYITEVPSSSSGKYHPLDEVGSIPNRGMIRHIKRAFVVADSIIRMRKHNDIDADILYAGVVLHDLLKCGWPQQKHTVNHHPTLIADKIDSYCKENKDNLTNLLPKFRLLGMCCRLHSGQWSSKEEIRVVNAQKPSKQEIKLIESMHFIDYVASRKEFYLIFQDQELMLFYKKIKKITKNISELISPEYYKKYNTLFDQFFAKFDEIISSGGLFDE